MAVKLCFLALILILGCTLWVFLDPSSLKLHWIMFADCYPLLLHLSEVCDYITHFLHHQMLFLQATFPTCSTHPEAGHSGLIYYSNMEVLSDSVGYSGCILSFQINDTRLLTSYCELSRKKCYL